MYNSSALRISTLSNSLSGVTQLKVMIGMEATVIS